MEALANCQAAYFRQVRCAAKRSDPAMERHLRRLSIIGTLGMILVLLMGATVTDTGSGEGCGRSWPLCRGDFLPASVRESVIEFSHRAITGVLGIVILLLAIGAVR